VSAHTELRSCTCEVRRGYAGTRVHSTVPAYAASATPAGALTPPTGAVSLPIVAASPDASRACRPGPPTRSARPCPRPLLASPLRPRRRHRDPEPVARHGGVPRRPAVARRVRRRCELSRCVRCSARAGLACARSGPRSHPRLPSPAARTRPTREATHPASRVSDHTRANPAANTQVSAIRVYKIARSLQLRSDTAAAPSQGRDTASPSATMAGVLAGQLPMSHFGNPQPARHPSRA
jgi:hypothetical protein